MKLLIPVCAVILINLGVWDVGNNRLLLENLNWQHILEIYFSSDSGWYRVIAENGYAHIPLKESESWSNPELHFAFFPLFPMCIKLITFVSGLSFYASAFVLNVGVLYLMVRYFYLFLMQLKIEELQAFRIVVILLLFPFSLHFYFIYTESVFFTLVVTAFYFISKRDWLKFGVVAGLVTLCRPNGLLLIVPYSLMILENDGNISIKGLKKAMAKPYYYILLIMPLVFGCWSVYQHMITGNYFAFSEAQSGWKKHFMFPLLGLFRNGFWQEQFDSIYCIIVMLLAIYWFKKWKAGFNAYVWIGILLPLSAGSVISMTRYISVLFPFHIQAGLSKFTNKYFKYIIAIFILLQLVCLKYWMEGNSLMY